MVVIIGVLAALIGPRIIGRIGDTRVNVAISNAESLKSAVKMFVLDCRPVKSGDTLRDILWQQPSDAPEGCWKGPYVDNAESLIDPWGSEFVLRVPGRVNVDFDIISYGADGTAGGDGEAADIER